MAKPIVDKTKGTDIMESMLMQQYQDSPNLKRYMLAFVEEMDLLFEQLEEVYLGRFLEYAEGRQLDVLGYILDEQRTVSLPTQFFGFNDDNNGNPVQTANVLAMADELNPSNGGIFLSEGQSIGVNSELSDTVFRRLLMAKAFVSVRETCDINSAYHAIAILLGRIPRHMKIVTQVARNVVLELSSQDTSGGDLALISYFAKYITPMGTSFAITRNNYD